ncbi:MAG: hypothetical protein HOO06_08605 [Bdellovibrionaceae bacterium]|nr:hypothetical protein [Pseudobdellovibrionaceae bacterium]
MKEKKSSHHGCQSIYRSNGTMPLDCGARGGKPRLSGCSNYNRAPMP